MRPSREKLEEIRKSIANEPDDLSYGAQCIRACLAEISALEAELRFKKITNDKVEEVIFETIQKIPDSLCAEREPSPPTRRWRTNESAE
jgi:hypothetical protein